MKRAILPLLLLSCMICAARPALSGAGDPPTAYQAAEVRGDYQKALQILQPLAARGDSDAEREMGYLYFFGHGVKQDWQMAAQWFQKAAEQGNVHAQTVLGALYTGDRNGMKRDDMQAVKWTRMAAEHDPEAAFNLGMMYLRGFGVPQDYAEAYFWLALAAKDPARSSNAPAQRDEAATHLTPDQKAGVDKRVADWKPPAARATAPSR